MGVAILALAIVLFCSVSIEARQGWCSWHGGVCGCSCCDGTPLSATCRPYYPECNGGSTPVSTYTMPTHTPTPMPTYSQCPTGSSLAVNDQTKCCPTGYPYYWSSDNMCHTVAQTTLTQTPTHTPTPIHTYTSTNSTNTDDKTGTVVGIIIVVVVVLYGIGFVYNRKQKAIARRNQGTVEKTPTKDTEPREPKTIKTSDNSAPLCPVHKVPMVRRTGRYGPFWGCPRYPSCKKTRKRTD